MRVLTSTARRLQTPRPNPRKTENRTFPVDVVICPISARLVCKFLIPPEPPRLKFLIKRSGFASWDPRSLRANALRCLGLSGFSGNRLSRNCRQGAPVQGQGLLRRRPFRAHRKGDGDQDGTQPILARIKIERGVSRDPVLGKVAGPPSALGKSLSKRGVPPRPYLYTSPRQKVHDHKRWFASLSPGRRATWAPHVAWGIA